ncbi:MAG: lysophospholipid acyltransferase family protein [Sneathiella sp.]
MNVLFLPMLAFNRIWIVRGQTVWSKGILVLMRATCGLKVEVRGTENLPKGRALLACKHQSIFETTAFHWLVEDPAVILKKELLSVPVYGWYCRKTKMIAVDRKGHASALRSMISQAEQALEDERQIIIFPEGTRTAVDDEMPYQPGIAALYTKLNTPVIPVALNTGLFWPRKKFMCRPGVIIIEFLPAIEAGLKRKDFVSKLKQSIDDNTSRLVAEGREKYIEK